MESNHSNVRFAGGCLTDWLRHLVEVEPLLPTGILFADTVSRDTESNCSI